MFSNGVVILIFFAGIVLIPLAVVLLILGISKALRKKKIAAYTGRAQGRIEGIVSKGLDHPWVIEVSYTVDGIDYCIKETAKLKSHAIKVGGIPIGQKKTFVLGPVKEGDAVTVCYDQANPEKALILGNDGVVTD